MKFKTVLLILASYLLGSVPFSFLVARTRGVDLRQVGSGNLGAGNVWRECGFRPFLVTVVCDILKGAALPLVAMRLLKLPPLSVVLVGAGAMLGHTFSIFMRFRGGKAAATGAGVMLTIFPVGLLAAAVAWFATVLVTRITSAGSLLASGLLMVLALVAGLRGRLELTYTLFTWFAGGLVIFLHRANIRRLLAGEENRLQKLW